MNKMNDVLIVSFAGHGLAYGGIPKLEFVKFLNTSFNTIDAQFYLDKQCLCYHCGIEGVSTNVEETVDYLKKSIVGYNRVIFIGASAGGYAAILFGSLLNVNTVIAFTPPTLLKGENKDKRYCDLNPYINPTTRYYVYGDENDKNVDSYHHIRHCENIAKHENVLITKKRGVNLKVMRSTGELFHIFKNVLEGRNPNHTFSSRMENQS
jgi:hypothetical protein